MITDMSQQKKTAIGWNALLDIPKSDLDIT